MSRDAFGPSQRATQILLCLHFTRNDWLLPTSAVVLGREIDADEFFVVADKHAPFGKRRVVPDHRTPKTLARRLEDVETIELLITLRRELCENQIPRFTKEKKTVLVLD